VQCEAKRKGPDPCRRRSEQQHWTWQTETMSCFVPCGGVGLKLERCYESEPYFASNDFWPSFLSNRSQFDHFYFIDVFVTILGEATMRRLRLAVFLQDRDVIHNRFNAALNGITKHLLKYIKFATQTARLARKCAFVTWQYPAVVDKEGHMESHYTMLKVDPAHREVLFFDSRGASWAPSRHASWRASYAQLQAAFAGYHWWDVIHRDTQASRPNDNFCQSWSLIQHTLATTATAATTTTPAAETTTTAVAA
jgi:hypothetical protein